MLKELSKRGYKELISELFKTNKIVTRKELINEGRKYVGNNQKYFQSVDSFVSGALVELEAIGFIKRIERGQYKKFV